MHELAICDALLRQVLSVAAVERVRRVSRIILRIGPLAGIEPDQLRLAFPLVAFGTPCESAVIEIECALIQVCCLLCGIVSTARPNRLLCAVCGAWRVNLVSGDEMLLARVELLDEWIALPIKEQAHV